MTDVPPKDDRLFVALLPFTVPFCFTVGWTVRGLAQSVIFGQPIDILYTYIFMLFAIIPAFLAGLIVMVVCLKRDSINRDLAERTLVGAALAGFVLFFSLE